MRSSVGYALISAAAQGGIMRGIWELRSVEARSSISGTTSCAVFSPEQLRPRGRQWHDGSALHVQGVRDEPPFVQSAISLCRIRHGVFFHGGIMPSGHGMHEAIRRPNFEAD